MSTILWGMEDTPKNEILARLLQQEYDIETLFTGCVGTTDEVYCYHDMMLLLLAKKKVCTINKLMIPDTLFILGWPMEFVAAN